MDFVKNFLNFAWVSDPSAWIGLLTLIALEIVLGIDNIVFISILSGKLPAEQQPQARKVGLVLAVVPRLVLLLILPLVLSLEKPVITLPFPDPGHSASAASGHGAGHGTATDTAHAGDTHGNETTAAGQTTTTTEASGAASNQLGLSIQDIIVVLGGLFLLYKATHEIHNKLEGEDHTVEGESKKGGATYAGVLAQIMLLNIVFSLDSIITAIGMVPKEQVMVMIIAVLVSTVVMAVSVNAVSKFVEKHPTVKMLALAFLLMIGMTLLIEGFHFHVPKGYVYFAMGFSVFVEFLNLRAKAAKAGTPAPVHLRGPQLTAKTYEHPE